MQPNNKCGQRYDAEFKENAVALVKSGRTLRAVANAVEFSDDLIDGFTKVSQIESEIPP